MWTSKINKLRLVDVIKKTNNLQEGIFANINNDLNDHLPPDSPPIIMMAYAYARRTAAAGLFLQGVFDRDVYNHASNIFKSMQLQTNHTIEFQQEAAQQAFELLHSYDSFLDKKDIMMMTSMVELDKTFKPYVDNTKEYLPYEVIVAAVRRTKSRHIPNNEETDFENAKNHTNQWIFQNYNKLAACLALCFLILIAVMMFSGNQDIMRAGPNDDRKATEYGNKDTDNAELKQRLDDEITRLAKSARELGTVR